MELQWKEAGEAWEERYSGRDGGNLGRSTVAEKLIKTPQGRGEEVR